MNLSVLDSANESVFPTTQAPRRMNATIFNEMRWQYWFFVGVSAPSLPLYLLIIVTICVRKPSVSAGNAIMATRRLNDVFYNLIISQGFADLLAIIVYFFTNVLQSLNTSNPFFLANSAWAAPLAYNNIYFFLVLRSNGIMLFSIQRYLVFVKDITNDAYKQQPLYTILLIHWGPTFVIMLPVTINFDKWFDPETAGMEVSPMQLGLSSGIACLTLIFNSAVSGLCYLAVVGAIYRKSSRKIDVFLSFRKTREFRLSVQVFVQVFAMMNCLAYHSIQFYILLVKEDYTHTLNHIREYYPIITSELSYVNPWCFVFLNNRLRDEMMNLLGIRRTKVINMMNPNFMDRKSSILNHSGPRRGSSLAAASLSSDYIINWWETKFFNISCRGAREAVWIKEVVVLYKNDDADVFFQSLKAKSVEAKLEEMTKDFLELMIAVNIFNLPELSEVRNRFLTRLERAANLTVDVMSKEYFATKQLKENSRLLEEPSVKQFHAVQHQQKRKE